ncbi:MAG: hypothetical protein P3X22_007660 [Thermoprotei archaeon]|nr:hypothetical protein [Thermoprotei archaeon]
MNEDSGALEVKVYLGIDWKSRLAQEILSEVERILASNYGFNVEINVMELPLGDTDPEAENMPIIVVNNRTVVRGRIPSAQELLDALFEALSSEVGETLLGFPLLDNGGEAEEDFIV